MAVYLLSGVSPKLRCLPTITQVWEFSSGHTQETSDELLEPGPRVVLTAL